VGATHQAIYSGTVDNDASGTDGVVSVKIGSGSSFELCSGSLLAPNVVLTARHCVSTTITQTVSCNELGESGNGDHVGADEPLDQLHVFTGAKPAYGGTPAASVTTIVHPDGGVLCNADIALLVLDKPITSVSPMRVRLASTPHSGEAVRAVGYGQNDDGMPVGTRFRRDAVQVLAIGQRVSESHTPLGSHEFEASQSICQGDSGGPAISEETGAVIGVVSRGGGCTDDFGHIFTATSGFADLVEKAFAIAGGKPLDEGVDPRANESAGTNGDETSPSAAPRHDASSGCAMGGGASGGDADTYAWLAGLFGAVGLVRRRRPNR
jgi:MYXO-CTERM domain-containing protein